MSFFPLESQFIHTLFCGLSNAFHVGGTVILGILNFVHPFAHTRDSGACGCHNASWCACLSQKLLQGVPCVQLPEQSLAINLTKF